MNKTVGHSLHFAHRRPYGVSDANKMQSLMRSLGFAKTNVITGKEATTCRFLQELTREASELDYQDILVVSFSTHGGFYSNAQEHKRPWGRHWETYDGYVTDYQIREATSAFVQGCRVVFIADACYSGGSIERFLKKLKLLEDKSVMPLRHLGDIFDESWKQDQNSVEIEIPEPVCTRILFSATGAKNSPTGIEAVTYDDGQRKSGLFPDAICRSLGGILTCSEQWPTYQQLRALCEKEMARNFCDADGELHLAGSFLPPQLKIYPSSEEVCLLGHAFCR